MEISAIVFEKAWEQAPKKLLAVAGGIARQVAGLPKTRHRLQNNALTMHRILYHLQVLRSSMLLQDYSPIVTHLKTPRSVAVLGTGP